jgi:DHA2 family multidrug resistance protein
MEAKETNKWIVALTVMTGTIMSALDTSIVNVAIPYMRGNLGASVEEITWVATGYLLSNVIVMPLVALLSSRFGRKKFYMFSVFLFTVASACCGMAWDLTSLTAFRIIQGLGGGGLIPVSQAILREKFPQEEQGMAMGIYGFGIVLGPAFGPTIGGWLTDHYSWPWIFYINIPVGIINLLMVARFIRDPHYLVREKGKIDLSGLVFMAIGLGALQIMLEKGEMKDWFQSQFIVRLFVISCIALLFFVVRELTADRPAVNLRILKDVNFTTGTLLGGLLSMGLYGSLFLLPLFLQQLLGYPAFDSGLTLIPRSIAMALIMPIAGGFYNRLGPRFLIAAGLAVCAYSFYQLSAMSLDVGYWDLFVPQFIQGLGFGMIFVSLSTVALSTIAKPKMTAATGLYNVFRLVFGSIGIAITATQLDRGVSRYRAILVENVTYFRDAAGYWYSALTQAVTSRGTDPMTAPLQAQRLIDGETMRQASMLAYNHVFFLIACLLTLSLPFVLLLGRKTASSMRERG